MALTANRSSSREMANTHLKAVVTDKAAKPVRININVEADLWKRLKVHAAEEGRTVSDITREFWEKLLSR